MEKQTAKKISREDETLQFLYMCRVDEVKMLVGKYRKRNLQEYVRLACIALVYGYVSQFTKIIAVTEKDFDGFMNGVKALNGNFALLEKWVTDFISGIGDEKVRKLAADFWEERKAELNKDNFNISQLVERSKS